MNKKILAIVGSNYKESFTNMLVKELLKNIENLEEGYETRVVCLSDYRIDYCNGCLTCSTEGFCPVDKYDDFTRLRETLSESDVIFFASPVYLHNISGIMKTFFDRISRSVHLMDYAGKLGFTLTTTSSSGHDIVKEYLIKIQEYIGIKNLENYIFSRAENNIEEFIEKNTTHFSNKIENNYGYTNRFLERYFDLLRSHYGNIGDKVDVMVWRST